MRPSQRSADPPTAGLGLRSGCSTSHDTTKAVALRNEPASAAGAAGPVVARPARMPRIELFSMELIAGMQEGLAATETPLVPHMVPDQDPLDHRPGPRNPLSAGGGSLMASIRDVARRAGVAPSTVSYVLNGDRSTTEDTRRRVQEAVEALDYHPQAGARMLRSGRTHVVALALPRGAGVRSPAGGEHPVDGRFAIEIADAAHRLGYDLLLATSGDKASGLRRVALSGLADAAVIMAVDLEDPRIDVAKELDFPAALIGRPADEGVLPWIDVDWEQAAVLAVRELAAIGYRDVVYLASAQEEVRSRRSSALHGIEGARRGARETGVAVRIAHSVDDPAEMTGLLRTLLPSGPRGGGPTALVVQHPTAYQHVLAAVGELGRRVPEDLAVVVIGSLPGDASCARLPRIELPVHSMATTAVRLAVGAADSRRPDRPSARRPRKGTLPAGSDQYVRLAPELVGTEALMAPSAAPRS